MLDNFNYFIHTSIFGGLCFLILLVTYRKLFIEHVGSLVKTLLIVLIGTLVVDHIAIKNNIWVLPKEKRFSLEIWDIPIDEFIFIIIMTLIVYMCTLAFLELENKKASVSRWLVTIAGISAIALVTFFIMSLLPAS